MKNLNPSLRKYFGELIPDESAFSYLQQQLSTERCLIGERVCNLLDRNGNNLEYKVPYYYYDSANKNYEDSQLLRGFYMCRATEKDLVLTDLFSLNTINGTWIDDDITQCAELVRSDVPYDDIEDNAPYIYYVVINCHRGREIKLSDKIKWCMGVAF